MKNIVRLFVWIVILIAGCPVVMADVRIDFALGAKWLDDDWEDTVLIGRVPATQGFETDADLANHAEFGVLFTWGGRSWPVDLAIDFLASTDEDDVVVVDFDTEEIFEIDLEGSTFELDVGVRKSWRRGSARIFAGGGLALVSAERSEEDQQDVTVSVEDEALGAWITGGAQWRVGGNWSVGFELRVSRAEVTLFGEDVEAGGEHLLVVGGFDLRD